MQDQEGDSPQLNKWEIAKIQLQAQALSNLLFGLSLVLIVTKFVGFPAKALIKLTILYLSIYGLIFIPYFLALPLIFLRPVMKLLDELHRGVQVDKERAKRAIKLLVEFPMRIAFIICPSVLSGFLIGVFSLRAGLIPEFMPFINVLTVATIAVGFVVSVAHALLNNVFLHNYFQPVIAFLASKYPQLLQERLEIKRHALFSKVFFVIFFSMTAGVISLAAFFLTEIAISYPEALAKSLAYSAIVMLLCIVYVFIVAATFTRSIVEPLEKLITWSRDIIEGNLNKKISIVTDDEFTEVAAYFNEMVEELKRERTLIEAGKDKLSVVLSSIADGVIALNQESEIVVFNDAAVEITGWTLEEVIGRKVDRFFHIYEEDGNRVWCDTDILRKFGLKLVTKNQKERYINLMGVTIKEPVISDVAYLLTFHDVTEEMELDRMKLDFVAMAAHELRTPITSIMGYLSVLEEEIGKDLKKEYQQFLNRALTSCNKLVALMENLLSITKIEKGEMGLHKKFVNWEELVKGHVEEFIPAAEDKNLKLSLVKAKTKIPSIEIDPLRIGEILNNLLSNAITYTKKGEVTVWCEYDREKNMVVTHIKDTGQGIRKKNQEHLFEKFYRVSGLLEEGSKGTGLGLYIAKSIVEMHGGEIWVDSKFEKGATFSFSLPVPLIRQADLSIDK
ncbi:HAMP domain-containing protein [Patescibacteria group bacterium]|nr:HAMP domain-containing protein [Patescibacteria group bacterium]MBU1868081.1 HAMP domain-containing protein [Patescibacteria group bacterium]